MKPSPEPEPEPDTIFLTVNVKQVLTLNTMAKTTPNIWTPLLFAATLAIGLFIGFRLQSNAPLIMSGTESTAGGRVEELLRFIEARYVDNAESDKLHEVAIRAVLDDLDPHSSYIPADELRA